MVVISFLDSYFIGKCNLSSKLCLCGWYVLFFFLFVLGHFGSQPLSLREVRFFLFVLKLYRPMVSNLLIISIF